MTAPTSAVAVPAPAAPARASISFGARGLQLQSFEDMFRFSKAVVASQLAPKSYRTPEQVLVAIETGAELGFGPMQSLTAFTVLNGVPRLSVEPALALVLASGLLEQRHDRLEGEGLQRRAVVALVRKGGLALERSFSVADAKRAGLDGKDNWKGYPDRMLYARAMGYALHDLFADVLRGMRIAETMDDGSEVVRTEDYTVEPQGPRPAAYPTGPDPLLAQIEAGGAPAEIVLEAHGEPEPARVPTEEMTDGSD